MKKGFKTITVVLIVLMYLSIGIFKNNNDILANQLDGYYFDSYWYNGGSTNNIPMMILKEYDNGTEVIDDNGPGLPQGILVYCLDIDLDYPFYDDPVKHFEQTTFDSSSYDLDKIKGILAEGFPNRSLKYLQDTLNIPSLTATEAIAATQYAIWSVTDSIDLDYWKAQTLSPTLEQEILFNFLKERVYVKPQEVILNFTDVKTQRLHEASQERIEIKGKITLSPIEQTLTLKINDSFTVSYPQAVVEINKNGDYFDFRIVLNESDATRFIATGTASFEYSYTSDVQEFHFVAPGPLNSINIQSLGGVTIKEIIKTGSLNLGVKEEISLLLEDTDYTVNKVWVGGPTLKPDIQVQLYQNDIAYGQPIILKNGMDGYTWENLDKTDSQGNAYIYSVDEIDPPTSYVKTVNGNTITNTFLIEKTNYTVNKVWVGGPTLKPDIQVQLYQNDIAYGQSIILKNGMDGYTWEHLNKTDSQGNAYIYSVDEINPPSSYSKTVIGNTIINTFKDQPTLPNTGYSSKSLIISLGAFSIGIILLSTNFIFRSKKY